MMLHLLLFALVIWTNLNTKWYNYSLVYIFHITLFISFNEFLTILVVNRIEYGKWCCLKKGIASKLVVVMHLEDNEDTVALLHFANPI